jgi:hypothetical protein
MAKPRKSNKKRRGCILPLAKTDDTLLCNSQEIPADDTRMQVFEVEDGVRVQPNCGYIIPPGSDLAFFNGTLQLRNPLQSHSLRLPIDSFFQLLAQDQHEKAVYRGGGVSCNDQ